MSSKANENFNFEHTPYARVAISAQTDGTTNPQDIAAPVNRPWKASNIGDPTANIFVEPEQQANNNQSHLLLDNLTRFIYYIARQGAGGTGWTYDFNFERATASHASSKVISGIAEASTVATWKAVDNPMESTFGKLAGANSLTDILNFNLTITPGSAVAETVFFVGILVPGFVAGASNKGAVFSAPQYLTQR